MRPPFLERATGFDGAALAIGHRTARPIASARQCGLRADLTGVSISGSSMSGVCGDRFVSGCCWKALRHITRLKDGTGGEVLLDIVVGVDRLVRPS